MQQSGWYKDPYGIHEARWCSEGVPTKLVRDGTDEHYDPAPDGPVPGVLEPLEPSEAELHAPEQSRQESPFVDIMDAIAQTTPPI